MPVTNPLTALVYPKGWDDDSHLVDAPGQPSDAYLGVAVAHERLVSLSLSRLPDSPRAKVVQARALLADALDELEQDEEHALAADDLAAEDRAEWAAERAA